MSFRLGVTRRKPEVQADKRGGKTVHKRKMITAPRINLDEYIQKAEATTRGTNPVHLFSACVADAEPHHA